MSKPIEQHVEYGPLKLFPSQVVYECGSLSRADATVCITLYNYGDRIVDALESVHEQTLERLGLVVLDDRSADDGPERVERWLRQHGGRFAGARLARHAKNRGLCHARNSVVSNAESPYVFILDADNQLYPRCVERLMAGLEGTAFGFAYCMLERFGDHAGLMGYSSWDPELLRRTNYIDAMAMIRRDIWRKLGGYAPLNVPGWEDYDFWCKCAESGIAGLFVPEVLARYRVHDESMLRSETNLAEKNRSLRLEMSRRHPWLDL